MEAAAPVQITPKITPATEPMAPMADGPRPGLTLFMKIPPLSGAASFSRSGGRALPRLIF